MKIVIVEPFKKARAAEISGELYDYQQIVGGFIEIVRPFRDNACIVCNDEGKLLGLPMNRPLEKNGRAYDVICGTFLIVGTYSGDEGEEFCSLTDEQVKRYLSMYKTPPLMGVMC